MKPRIIWTIVILMSIALIGLTAFQIHWINNAIKLNREIFEENVMSSIRQVVNNLEHREVARIVESNYVSYTDEGLQLIIQEQGTTYESEELVVVASDSLPIAQTVIRKSDTTYIKLSPAPPSSPLPELAMEVDTSLFNVKSKILSHNRVVNVVMEQLINPKRKHERMSRQLIDSLLGQALTDNGINIQYQFAVWNKDQDTVYTTNTERIEKDLRNTELKAALFPNDLISNSNYLLVNFPEETSYLYRQIWTTLTASVIFIIMIVACFAYAIYIILRQKKLSEMKNDFINNMTHELKTPIATVGLAVEALNEPEMRGNEPTLLRYLSIIDQENTRLSAQVEKVLQSALLDKETFNLKLESIQLDQLLIDVIEKAQISFEAKGGTIKFEKLPSITLQADKHHLTNVISNLIDNAMKYAKQEPHVELSVRTNGKFVTIAVKDHGIGISHDAQRYIFDKFYRVPTGNRHDVKGFGLGLSYVKTIVEKHGGEVGVNSEIGVGSTFTVTLPYEQ